MEKQKSGKGLIIAILLIVIISIAGGVFYYIKNTSPKNIFVNQISGLMGNVNSSNTKEISDIRKINATVALSGNIETTNSEIKEIAEILNEGKIGINFQSDLDTKNTLIGLDLDYKNEKLIQAKEFYHIGDNNAYLFIQDLYDKYFKINIDESLKDLELDSLLNLSNSSSEVKVQNLKEANKIFKDVISENLKDEYFSKETAEDMTKNTMKISIEELFNLYTNVATSLRDNSEFLNCYENPDKVKEYYNEYIESIPELKKMIKEYADDLNFELSLYTQGFSSELKKVEVRIADSKSEEVKFIINKVDENTYEYLLELKTETSGMPITAEALKGTFKIEKKDDETKIITFVIDNIPDVGKVTLNIEVKVLPTTDLENVNVSDSVDVDNMSDNELMKLYTNLTNMKIYPYIAPYLGL